MVNETRILIPKDIAQKFLFQCSRPEFRFDVFFDRPKTANFHAYLLGKFRDGRLWGELSMIPKIGTMTPMEDLGVKAINAKVSIWSCNRIGILNLLQNYENGGYETSGVW